MADCVFCRISRGEIPSKKLYEDSEITAFSDANPQAPVHFLVIPREHIANVYEAAGKEALLGKLLSRAAKIACEQGLGERGARFVVNCKEDGGQTVDHLHIHVLGGRALDWPPG